MHRLPSRLLENAIRVTVVGCGGTGSAVVAGLAYLHQSLRALGHPHGLRVELYDGDVVSPANCVRQAFSPGELGQNKAVVLATRMNLFWGLDWEGHPCNFGGRDAGCSADILFGCVDTRRARKDIAKCAGSSWVGYWLDFGNSVETGQVVLGQPLNMRNRYEGRRLPTVAELYPEILDVTLDAQDAGPSCSAAEAVARQAPFVNQVLANHGLALVGQLLRHGEINHHGMFVNLRTGQVRPIPVPAASAITEEDAREVRALKRCGFLEEDLREAYRLDEYEYRQVTAPRRKRAA